jgi:hypothetical protein
MGYCLPPSPPQSGGNLEYVILFRQDRAFIRYQNGRAMSRKILDKKRPANVKPASRF